MTTYNAHFEFAYTEDGEAIDMSKSFLCFPPMTVPYCICEGNGCKKSISRKLHPSKLCTRCDNRKQKREHDKRLHDLLFN